MIKRLEGIQKGQKVYVVPSDSRCKPQWAEVYSVGPKKITLKDMTPDLREFDTRDGRSIGWQGWELFLSKKQYEEYQKKQYEEYKELLQLRSRVSWAFDQMVRKCEDINKLRRLYKRYKEYYDGLPF